MPSKKRFLIVYSSDLHGNVLQYKKLLNKSYVLQADAILIGGDITPKDPKQRTILGQRTFFTKKLVPLLKQFTSKNKKRGHSCKIYLILGNDDFKSNLSFFKKFESRCNIKFLNRQLINLNSDFKIGGYSYVPLTPFEYKDWEKVDTVKRTESKFRKDARFQGLSSSKKSLVRKKINLNNRDNSIENDLMSIKGGSNCIMMIHAPPFNTSLDHARNGKHVGSIAVKNFIKTNKPYLTFHGHIHETVERSKKFTHTSGKTLSIASGNDHRGNKLAIIVIDIYDTNSVRRLII